MQPQFQTSPDPEVPPDEAGEKLGLSAAVSLMECGDERSDLTALGGAKRRGGSPSALAASPSPELRAIPKR